MRKNILRYGLMGMMVCLGGVAAHASFIPATPAEALGAGPTATPIAMCGFSCRTGGRYIPGPPGVCFARGLNYCGPSGYGGPPPWAGRGFYGPPRRYYGSPYYGPRRYGW